MPEAIPLGELYLHSEKLLKLRCGNQRLPRVIGDDAPVAHHQHAIYFRQDVRKVVRDHHDAGALLRDASQSLPQFALGGHIQCVRGLIEQQHLRPVDKRTRNHDATLFPCRHFSYKLVREMRRLHQFKRLGRALPHLR